ncbi:MAG: DUF6456 domain-containing protein, partial [Oceanicaulis sp.]
RATPAGAAKVARRAAPEPFGFLAQHAALGRRPIVDRKGVRLALARMDGPLARYLRPQGTKPPLLSAVHASAAEIFTRDYARSALQSRVTQDWSGLPGAKTRAAPKDRADAPGTRLDAQKRVMDALDAAGPGYDRLLMNILVRETGMLAAERDLGWRERTGAPALKIALDRLAAHYRLTPGKAEQRA